MSVKDPALHDELDGFGDEYAVVRSPVGYGGASIIFFVLLFFGGEEIFRALDQDWRRVIPILLGLLLAGLTLALIGLRRDEKRFAARIGILLHVGGILSILVPVAGFFFVLNR